MKNEEEQSVMSGLTLSRVVILARHGARSSTATIQQIGASNWNKESFYTVPAHVENVSYNLKYHSGKPRPFHFHTDLSCGGASGRLTTIGYEGNYAIGEHIKSKYGTYDQKDVYIRSTNMKRTIESARAIYAGLTGGRVSEIDIEIGEADEEYLSTQHSCKTALGHTAWIWFAGGLYEPMRPLLAECIRVLKLETIPEYLSQTDFNPLLIHDDITARLQQDIVINSASKKELLALYPIIEQMALMVCCGSNGMDLDDKIRCLPLKSGRLLQYIINELDSPLSILSAHDTTLIPMIEALMMKRSIADKAKTIKFPPYSAHIDFEFYKDINNTDFIRILYLGEPVQFDGEDFVQLEHFKKHTEWLRLEHDEWKAKKDTKLDDSRFTDEEISAFTKDPRKHLNL